MNNTQLDSVRTRRGKCWKLIPQKIQTYLGSNRKWRRKVKKRTKFHCMVSCKALWERELFNIPRRVTEEECNCSVVARSYYKAHWIPSGCCHALWSTQLGLSANKVFDFGVVYVLQKPIESYKSTLKLFPNVWLMLQKLYCKYNF